MIKKREYQDFFEIISIIWGEEFTNFYLEILIPNYLSINNIPAASKKNNIKIKIYTKINEKEKIINHPNFQKLSSYIVAEIITIIDDELLNNNNKWSIKGHCQSHAIKEGIKNKSIVLLFNPDALISDGFIKQCCELSKKYNVVEILEYARCDKEKIHKLLLNSYYDKDSHCITLSNQELVKIGLENKLEYLKYLSIDNPSNNFTMWPSILYWEKNNQNVMARSFHLHPILINLKNIKIKNITNNLMPDDGGLTEYLGFTKKDKYIITNSEELVAIELTRKDNLYKDLIINVKNKCLYLAKWANLYCSPNHINNFLKNTFSFKGNNQNKNELKLDSFFNFWFLKMLLKMVIFKKIIFSYMHLLRKKIYIAKSKIKNHIKYKMKNPINKYKIKNFIKKNPTLYPIISYVYKLLKKIVKRNSDENEII